MGSANTHLTHLEELVLTQGERGYEMARAFLLELLETLKGNSNSHVQTSVKWDGAPAMFVGINPENGKFFVGTKSIFNKIPKINYTEEDIIENHGHAPGLVDKLTKALKYLPSLGIKNILQGDFMFDDEMLDVVDIDGEPHYRFKPNTIVYAVPVNSDLGKEIGQSKFGIVFHTTYDSLDSGASFGADVSGLRRVPGIWFDDAFFTDDTGTVTLTENEERKVISLVEQADSVNGKIDYNNLPSDFLNIYINSEIKTGQFLESPEASFVGFKDWYSGRIEKRISGLKSEKGRVRANEKGKQDLQLFDGKREDILNLFRVSRLLFEAKNVFIEKYNNAVYNTKHFVDDGSGDLIVTNPEGYVAVDHEGNGVKFVDRLEFSRANFMIDKSAKFTQESMKRSPLDGHQMFTIQVSKDKQISKTLKEWTKEIKINNHIYQKLPQLVYKDVLAGTPIVDIVLQENAEKTVYNAVIGYISESLADMDQEYDDEWNEFRHYADQDLGLPPEDEDEDPVVDIDFDDEPTTWAIVPGAFKPPHKGHADMVRRYATGDGVPKADKVIVVISAPMNAQRQLRDGTTINEDHAIEFWKELFPEVANLPNVEFEIASKEMRSPITVAYEYISERSPLPLKDGDRVILGASDKPDTADRPDWARWDSVNDEKHVKHGIELLRGEEYAVPALGREGGGSFSASIARDLISDLVDNPSNKEAYDDLSDFVPANRIGYLFDTLDKPRPIFVDKDLEETSVMGGGGMAAPMTRGPEEDEATIIRHENIDLNTIDEVMRLIMEKGIMR
jgi:hypothetical protein